MHSLLVETMPSGYFFSGVNTPASASKHPARATPKGLPLTAKVHRAICSSLAMPALCR